MAEIPNCTAMLPITVGTPGQYSLLVCDLPEGHDGLHHDEQDKVWWRPDTDGSNDEQDKVWWRDRALIRTDAGG